MKTKYLLPHRWKVVGWVLIAICIPLGVWVLFPYSEYPLSLEISVPWSYDKNPGLLDPQIIDGQIVLNIADELISVGCIAGLLIVGFSKQLVEDERIARLRLEALQWGVYANYFVLTLCILMIYGTAFLSVMIYNMFTMLIIFVARFYWLLKIKPAIDAKKERNLSL